MTTKLLSALKVSALALILSLGLSYVYAWTSPAQQAPAGNVAAPINVGGTTQTKLNGDICTTVSGITKCLQTAGADNLGNHTATQALNMAGNNITNAGTVTATGLTTTGSLRVTGGTPAASKVLTSDASGNATWQTPASGADNLGNHTATQALNMAGNNINNAGSITATNGIDVGNAGGTYTYVTLRDDESPNGVKYIHANSNVVGFLSGAGSWLSYWDNAGGQYNVGNINTNDYYNRVGAFWGSQSTPHGKQRFTASGTFTVPAGVTKVWVTMSGGGGGGVSSCNYAGGGAAAVIAQELAVTSGASYAITIGAGGAGGWNPSACTVGTAGGASSFGSLFTTNGGGGATAGAPGASGGAGGNPGASGIGGSSIFGNGGYGPTAGVGYGAGGGGGSSWQNGGAGAPGFVLVEW